MRFALSRIFAALGVGAASVALAFGGCSRSPSGSENNGQPDGGGHGGSSGAAETGAGGSSGSGATGGSAVTDAGDSGTAGFGGAQWSAVPADGITGDDCQLYTAIPGTSSFPPLAWTSCGDGCEWTDPSSGSSSAWPPFAISASMKGGKAFYQFGVILAKAPPWSMGILRIVSAEDGVTVTALAERFRPGDGFSPCDVAPGNDSATTLNVIGAPPAHMTIYGFAPAAPTASWIWAQPPAPLASFPPVLVGFSAEDRVFYTGQGGVFAMLDPKTSSAWTTLEAPSDAAVGGAEGDLAVWSEWSTDRIRGWAPDGKGVRTLIESAPSKTCQVKPSATELVGFAEDGGCDASYAYNSARFWHVPRTYDLVSNVSVSQNLATTSLGVPLNEIRTWGDFAGIVAADFPDGSPTEDFFVLVYQLSTGKAWRVYAEPGYIVHLGTFVFDDSYLYFGETKTGANYDKNLYKMRRIALDKLDAWGTPP